MAYDGWIDYNGVELVNLSRTAQLAQTLGIDTVWITPESVQWIEDSVGGADYGNPANAPWYTSDYAPSGEFAGIVPIGSGFAGLDDSTLSSTPTEYITDGGHSGKPRNETKAIVVNVAIIASSDVGAEFGKQWLTRVLRDSSTQSFCSGADLTYFLGASENSGIMHHRDVRLTRGLSVTRKRRASCSSTWFVTFTLTAADPFEYGETVNAISSLGIGAASGSGLINYGQSALVQQSCPVFDYSPIFDPEHPALVAAPTAPDFYPDGWDIYDGYTFDRHWARFSIPIAPLGANVVPVIRLTTDFDARMVRLCLWPGDADPEDQCDPLFSVVMTYLPPDMDIMIDGEQQAVYVYDGGSPQVRRADSLAYTMNADPLQWVTLSNETMIVTLDTFHSGSEVEGDGTVEASVAFLSKTG